MARDGSIGLPGVDIEADVRELLGLPPADELLSYSDQDLHHANHELTAFSSIATDPDAEIEGGPSGSAGYAPTTSAGSWAGSVKSGGSTKQQSQREKRSVLSSGTVLR